MISIPWMDRETIQAQTHQSALPRLDRGFEGRPECHSFEPVLEFDIHRDGYFEE
jgi:hypothetical protein